MVNTPLFVIANGPQRSPQLTVLSCGPVFLYIGRSVVCVDSDSRVVLTPLGARTDNTARSNPAREEARCGSPLPYTQTYTQYSRETPFGSRSVSHYISDIFCTCPPPPFPIFRSCLIYLSEVAWRLAQTPLSVYYFWWYQ